MYIMCYRIIARWIHKGNTKWDYITGSNACNKSLVIIICSPHTQAQYIVCVCCHSYMSVRTLVYNKLKIFFWCVCVILCSHTHVRLFTANSMIFFAYHTVRFYLCTWIFRIKLRFTYWFGNSKVLIFLN